MSSSAVPTRGRWAGGLGHRRWAFATRGTDGIALRAGPSTADARVARLVSASPHRSRSVTIWEG